MPLLDVQDLKVSFFTEPGETRVVDGVSFNIEPERTLGVVGESGCGKSVTALAVMGLLERPGRIVSGRILYRSRDRTVDLTRLPPRGQEMRSIRGNEISMIFQEPMTSLNPAQTIGTQIKEAIITHQDLGHKGAREKAIHMLRAVGIPAPAKRIDEYPHQLSGGMRQRVMIAMALSCNPSLLIADEPTTALDVTIQAQVLELIEELRKEFRTAILFITHNLGVVAREADDVLVMYLGRVVELAPTREIFRHPGHPYTKGLLVSMPSLTVREKHRLVPIEGVVPDPTDIPGGCVFHPRCPHAMKICRSEIPVLREIAPGHSVSCWLQEGVRS
ncbi:MAG: ABC transporter ATP-binding protein [Spirochaetales bacterium]|nr:ABC transporter ATP-binding protein [Spirochaetales bacterium]